MSNNFYVQRHASGLCGNCILWWAKDNNGYTCDLDNSKLFSYEEAMDLERGDQGAKYTLWPEKMVRDAAVTHVRIEPLRDAKTKAEEAPSEVVDILDMIAANRKDQQHRFQINRLYGDKDRDVKLYSDCPLAICECDICSEMASEIYE